MTSARRIKRRLHRQRASMPRRWFPTDFDPSGRDYMLIKRRPVKARTWSEAMTWVQRVQPGDARSTVTLALTKGNGFVVSTIFLVTSHGLHPDHPVLFETMHRAKNGGWDGGRRYYTYEAAMKGHREYFRELAREASKPKNNHNEGGKA